MTDDLEESPVARYVKQHATSHYLPFAKMPREVIAAQFRWEAERQQPGAVIPEETMERLIDQAIADDPKIERRLLRDWRKSLRRERQ